MTGARLLFAFPFQEQAMGQSKPLNWHMLSPGPLLHFDRVELL